jgi:hypothetical protein
MTTFPALNPVGYPPQISARGLAPSLDSIEGKKLFLVDVGFENSDNFMQRLQGWLGQNRPEVSTEVVRWHDMHKPDPELSGRIKAEGDAAILGVGL